MDATSKETLSIDTMSSEQLFDWVANLLAEMFELDRSSMRLQSNLYLDLDIDSIDAVDLAVKLTQLTGKRLAPEKFRTIRTIADIVAALATFAGPTPTVEQRA
jgi:acyl carrier protein